jgi:hypothetical protein
VNGDVVVHHLFIILKLDCDMADKAKRSKKTKSKGAFVDTLMEFEEEVGASSPTKVIQSFSFAKESTTTTSPLQPPSVELEKEVVTTNYDFSRDYKYGLPIEKYSNISVR